MKIFEFLNVNERFFLYKQRKFWKGCEIAVLYILSVAALYTMESAADTEIPKEKPRKYKFKDFIEKYSPVTVWDQIDQEKSQGANYTLEEETEKFFNAIDPTDELLNLKVQNGDAKILTQRNGRRWMPKHGPPSAGFADPKTLDPWNNRFRVVELMKQAIYQARNKMVIMQQLRDEFRNHSSFKMGYLVAKTDFATKTLAQFAYRALRACSTKRQTLPRNSKTFAFSFLEMMYTIEKQMHLWLEVDLMIELFWTNHLIAQRATNKRKVINQKRWNARFVN